MQYWLVKSEPYKYSYDDLVKDKKTFWDGVRNYQARNNLRAMKKGDQVLYYHSVDEKSVVGVAEVAKEHYPDPTAKEGDWSVVDLKPVKKLPNPVSLADIKAKATLSDMSLVRQARLSVTPVSKTHFQAVLKMGGLK